MAENEQLKEMSIHGNKTSKKKNKIILDKSNGQDSIVDLIDEDKLLDSLLDVQILKDPNALPKSLKTSPK